MSNPTPKQKRILDYLKEFIDKHGRPPTLEEIARRFRLRSLSTVHAHLAKLREKAGSPETRTRPADSGSPTRRSASAAG